VVEGRDPRQPDQQVPVLEEGQLGVEGAGLREQRTLDQQRVEGDVVVEEQQLGVEVAAVGEPPLDRAPASPASIS
jgi:hypothetical protein